MQQSQLDGKIFEPSRNNSYPNKDAIFCFLPVTSVGESRTGLTAMCWIDMFGSWDGSEEPSGRETRGEGNDVRQGKTGCRRQGGKIVNLVTLEINLKLVMGVSWVPIVCLVYIFCVYKCSCWKWSILNGMNPIVFCNWKALNVSSFIVLKILEEEDSYLKILLINTHF